MFGRLFLIISLIAAGCTKSPSSSSCFRMNLHSEPSSLDPRLVRDIPTLTVAKMFFDGLVRPTQEGELALSLAEKVEVSKDKKRYIFYLREARWTNGSPVTAYDFEYSWKSTLDPNFPAEFAHQLYVLKNGEKAKRGEASPDEVGVRALGAKKLLVELEYADPYFFELLSFPICYPISKKAAEADSRWASAQGDGLVSCGPFQLVEWNPSSELVAKKSASYWDRSAVQLDRIVLTMIEDEHTELNMYENDELDWAGSPNSSIPPEAIPSLRCKSELSIVPVAGTYCYKFNTQKEPFNIPKMRRAFALAIHRKPLVEDILQAGQIVAKALVPPCMQERPSECLSLPDGESALAKALFEEGLIEGGWSRESLPEITLFFSKSEKHQKVAQAIQQEWNQTFDIKVQLQSYEWNSYLDKLSRGDFQVGGKGWIADISDPKTQLEIYCDGREESGWQNADFSHLIEVARKESDLERRGELLFEAEQILLADMPIVPLYHSTACFLKKPYVKGITVSKLCDIDLKQAYIQR